MNIARALTAASAWRPSSDFIRPIGNILKARRLTLERRIAAPAIVACVLAGSIFYGSVLQQGYDTARAERDAKRELLERLSPASERGAVRAADLGNPFVPAETATTAAAEIDRLVRAVAAKANGVVLSTQASVEQGRDATTRRIEIQTVIEGRLDAIQRTLFNLETGTPLMFIDDLALQPVERIADKKTSAQAPLLQLSLTLSAYWRSGP